MSVRIMNGLDAECQPDAADLVFEYMAVTQLETVGTMPSDIRELPPVLQSECEHLSQVYAEPGRLFVAYCDDLPAGCVGLITAPGGGEGVIRRLYVRPAYRSRGVGRLLMTHAHRHAAKQNFARVVLDVLRTRSQAVDFYRHLGYLEDDPRSAGPPSSLMFMQRPVR